MFPSLSSIVPTAARRVLAGAVLSAALSASAAAFPSGLVSYWNFDEGSGLAIDSVGGNDGTLGAGAIRTAGTIGSGAISFNNTASAFVNVGSALSASAGIAIEALIKPSWTGNVGDYDEIMRKEDGGLRFLLSFQNDSGTVPQDDPDGPAGPAGAGRVLSFGLSIAGVYTELDLPLDTLTLAGLQDGDAHHVVATYDSTTGKKAIWIDGALMISATKSGLITSGGGAAATIGNLAPGAGEPFNGTIDEVAFYDRGLTAAEIAAHYANVQAVLDYFAVPAPAPFAGLAFGLAALARLRRRTAIKGDTPH
jgi:hypothetical protein